MILFLAPAGQPGAERDALGDRPAAVAGGVYRTPRVLGRFAEVLSGQFLAHPPIAPYTVHVLLRGTRW